jgi:hypothetical protein
MEPAFRCLVTIASNYATRDRAQIDALWRMVIDL